jgi:uncharacterized membrane protein
MKDKLEQLFYILWGVWAMILVIWTISIFLVTWWRWQAGMFNVEQLPQVFLWLMILWIVYAISTIE